MMDWKDILTILVPLFTFLGFIYHQMNRKFDLIDKKFDKIDQRFEKMEEKLQNIDSRIARIEGHLTGMHYGWDPKIIEKKEDK